MTCVVTPILYPFRVIARYCSKSAVLLQPVYITYMCISSAMPSTIQTLINASCCKMTALRILQFSAKTGGIWGLSRNFRGSSENRHGKNASTRAKAKVEKLRGPWRQMTNLYKYIKIIHKKLAQNRMISSSSQATISNWCERQAKSWLIYISSYASISRPAGGLKWQKLNDAKTWRNND